MADSILGAPEPVPPKPKIIYHYCPVQAFHGIVSSATISLTNATTTNDLKENQVVFHVVDIVDFLRGPLGSPHSDADLFRQIKEYLKSNNPDPYIACFSEQRDLLSQWTRYADDGNGFVIGFYKDFFNLTNIPPAHYPKMSDSKETLSLVRMIYDQSIQQQLVNSAVENAKKVDETPELVEKLSSRLIRIYSYLFKHSSYLEEQEQRILYIPKVEIGAGGEANVVVGSLKELKYRPFTNGLIPYFDLGIATSDGKSPIAEVLVGPCNRTPLATVTSFLSRHGFSGVKVEKSACPYGGRS